jgi:hypothetical protein
MSVGQLPDKRWFEYSWVKHSNPALTYDQWSTWDEWDYSAADRDRFSRIILNNLDLITDKKVFDILEEAIEHKRHLGGAPLELILAREGMVIDL